MPPKRAAKAPAAKAPAKKQTESKGTPNKRVFGIGTCPLRVVAH